MTAVPLPSWAGEPLPDAPDGKRCPTSAYGLEQLDPDRLEQLVQELNAYLPPNPVDGGWAPLSVHNDQVLARFGEWRLGSQFVPVLAPDSDRLYAHEARLDVAGNGQTLHPHMLYAVEREPRHITYLDRLIRVLHAVNHTLQHPGSPGLRLDVHAGHLRALEHGHGVFFQEVLHRLGRTPAEVTLQVIAHAECDSPTLHAAADAYRVQGYQVALSLDWPSQKDLERVWLLDPVDVRLPGILASRLLVDSHVKRTLPRAVEVLHELGADVSLPAVTSPIHAQAAQAAGFDAILPA